MKELLKFLVGKTSSRRHIPVEEFEEKLRRGKFLAVYIDSNVFFYAKILDRQYGVHALKF